MVKTHSQHDADQKRNDGNDVLSRLEKNERLVEDVIKTVNELKEFIMNRSDQNGGAIDNGRKFFSSPTLNKKKARLPNLETISTSDGYLIKRRLKKGVASRKDEKAIPAVSKLLQYWQCIVFINLYFII